MLQYSDSDNEVKAIYGAGVSSTAVCAWILAASAVDISAAAAASATGQALLLMANEVSGSLTVFEVSPRY